MGMLGTVGGDVKSAVTAIELGVVSSSLEVDFLFFAGCRSSGSTLVSGRASLVVGFEQVVVSSSSSSLVSSMLLLFFSDPSNEDLRRGMDCPSSPLLTGSFGFSSLNGSVDTVGGIFPIRCCCCLRLRTRAFGSCRSSNLSGWNRRSGRPCYCY